jgi:hypothetical protein
VTDHKEIAQNLLKKSKEAGQPFTYTYVVEILDCEPPLFLSVGYNLLTKEEFEKEIKSIRQKTGMPKKKATYPKSPRQAHE